MPAAHRDLLVELRREWRSTGRTAAARRAVTALRTGSGPLVPAGVGDLADLVRALEPDGGLDQLHRARLVALLLARSDRDPLLRRCLLQTLLPGIVSVARQLRFGDGIADDPRAFLTDALAEAYELIESWAGQRRVYAAPDLLSALRCRMRRRLLAERSHRDELTDPPELAGVDEDDALVARLCEDAQRGVTDVDLVY
ncbi:MAG TPA: hypothetical protein VKT18_06880, partial [Acidimicrobiales bacterium]|nr:hypothetical protein [Acidimicrobiales bacterium]